MCVCQGDCDGDSDCKGDLTCGTLNAWQYGGMAFGFDASDDVCTDSTKRANSVIAEVSADTVFELYADGVRVGPGGKGRYQNNVARECAGCGVRIERDGAPDMRANELEVRSRLEP